MGNCASDPIQTHSVGGVAESQGNALAESQSTHQEAEIAAELLRDGHLVSSAPLEIRVRAKSLRDADYNRKCDPMAVLYQVCPDGQEKELGRTECLMNNINPVFTLAITVMYNFETIQRMRLVVVDVERKDVAATVDPDTCTLLGHCCFTLSELVKAHHKALVLHLDSQGIYKTSKAMILCEELSQSRAVISCQLAGVHVRNIELWGRSDPYVEICKRPQDDEEGDWQPVFRTEVVPSNLYPTWKPFTLRAVQLNNGDPYRPLLVRVMDYEGAGHHRFLGQVLTSQSELESAFKSNQHLKLLDRKRVSGPQPRDRGCLEIKSWHVEDQPSFLDYLSAGTDIAFIVGIDFTASNLAFSDPSSLHHAPQGGHTPYEEVLTAVGRVLETYDTDRLFPAFGFGAMQGVGQPVSHCFPLNGRDDAMCEGLTGIKEAYRHALRHWKLAGPTHFAPLINTAAEVASEASDTLHYTVLLILTDGQVTDVKETIDAVVHASHLPMSVLIVGIGTADFTNVRKLHYDNSNDTLRSSDGERAERDIVQFVEYSKFQGNAQALATELLAELPRQFLEYVRARKIPLPSPTPCGLGPNPSALWTPHLSLAGTSLSLSRRSSTGLVTSSTGLRTSSTGFRTSSPGLRTSKGGASSGRSSGGIRPEGGSPMSSSGVLIARVSSPQIGSRRSTRASLDGS